MKFYHATTSEVMDKIISDGVIKAFWEGVVYLCKDAKDSSKFLIVRAISNIKVIEVELDESDVEESFDHSEAFFKCKAYIHKGDILLTGKENVFDVVYGGKDDKK